jgi:hypothetical protein
MGSNLNLTHLTPNLNFHLLSSAQKAIEIKIRITIKSMSELRMAQPSTAAVNKSALDLSILRPLQDAA